MSKSDVCLQQTDKGRKKCAGCKISVHTVCLEQLEKVKAEAPLWIYALGCFLFPLLTSPVFRLISGASRRSGNPDVEPCERSVRADSLKPESCAETSSVNQLLSFSPTSSGTTGSTGGARRASVDSAGR